MFAFISFASKGHDFVRVSLPGKKHFHEMSATEEFDTGHVEARFGESCFCELFLSRLAYANAVILLLFSRIHAHAVVA